MICELATRLFDRNTRNVLLCLWHAQYVKMTTVEYLLGSGFESCEISIY